MAQRKEANEFMITNAIQAGAALLTYSNLVVQLLTGQVKDVARGLELRQNAPFEPAQMEIQLAGKPIEVSATVRSENFEFLFLRGHLFRVGWKHGVNDLDDWDRLVTPHLANSARVVSVSNAEDRALRLLSQIHANTNKLMQESQSTVTAEQIETVRTRLYSNDKIRITVSLKSKKPKKHYTPEIRMQLLATTGEVIGLDVLDYDGTVWEGIFGRPQMRVSNASDLASPLIVSASGKSETFQTGDTNAIPGLAKRVVEQLRARLGTNRAKLYVVEDNLNAPAVVAGALKDLLTDAPVVGTAERWRDDLPLPKALQDEFKKGYRGMEIHAICGEVTVATKLITLPEITPPIVPVGHISNDERFTDLVRTLNARAEGLVNEMRPLANKITWPFELDTGAPQYNAFQHAVSKLVSKRDDFVDLQSFGMSSNVYWNGGVITNGYVSVVVSGDLPFSRAQWGTQSADYDAVKPLVDFSEVGAHPMEFVTTLFGEQAVKLLLRCDRVEAYRVGGATQSILDIGSGRIAAVKKGKTVSGYKVIAPAKEYGGNLGKRIFDAFINDHYPHESWVDNCVFDPGVAFVCWSGKERVEVLLCFHCDDVSVTSFDATGKQNGNAYFSLRPNRAELVKLCKEVFSGDAVIRS